MPRKKVTPIPADERKEWDQIIAQTKEVVATQDATQWQLVLLAGQVQTKYGEQRINRWADESGISDSAAKQYRWLSKKGVDEAFVKKYGSKLNYSVVREVASFCGAVTSPHAIEYLDYAIKHKCGRVAILGYMLQTTAPHEGKAEAEKSISLALRTKQSRERFDDYILAALEKVAEEHPELEKQILETTITSAKDLEALEVAAGVLKKEEERIVAEGKRQLDKIKRFRQWLMQNQESIENNISYGHEYSQELQHFTQMIGEVFSNIGNTKLPDLSDIEAKEFSL
jgi:hypothetical protein